MLAQWGIVWYFDYIKQIFMAYTSSIDILNLLVEAGLDREKAEPLAKEILTRTEAVETLSTKRDLAELKTSIIQWVSVLLLAQAGLTATLVKLLS